MFTTFKHKLLHVCMYAGKPNLLRLMKQIQSNCSHVQHFDGSLMSAAFDFNKEHT